MDMEASNWTHTDDRRVKERREVIIDPSQVRMVKLLITAQAVAVILLVVIAFMR